MPLESGTTISELIATWPLSGDFVSEGDNHLNLIKSVLKKQFPGSTNQGFNKPILATEDEINYLQGTRSNIQAQIDAVAGGGGNGGTASEFPAGTTMIFFQAAPPTGWTQLTANNDSMLRVVSSAGGGAGGGASPISHRHTTGGHALSVAELPAGLDASLVLSIAANSQSDDHSRTSSVARGNADPNTINTDAIGIIGANGASHSHGDTGFTNPRYIDVITAVKD